MTLSDLPVWGWFALGLLLWAMQKAAQAYAEKESFLALILRAVFALAMLAAFATGVIQFTRLAWAWTSR